MNKNEHRSWTAALAVFDNEVYEIERRWGADRLQRLAPEPLRTKFLAAQAQLDEAISAGDIERTAHKATVLLRGWRALEQGALDAGHKPQGFEFWPVTVDGEEWVVAAHNDELPVLAQMWPGKRVDSVEGLIRLANATRAGSWLGKVQEGFPGAGVVYAGAARSSTIGQLISDELPF